jgi:hypothetical protein
MTAGDVTVTGAAGHLSAQDRSRRAQEVIFDIKSKRNTRALCVLPFGHKEANMDNTTLLIIIILVVILLGGGWYGRGRWF